MKLRSRPQLRVWTLALALASLGSAYAPASAQGLGIGGDGGVPDTAPGDT
ncbi:MAG: hypothetical protein ACYS26_18360 [Planctomycetota bacterium]|jgi:hypothetical protein